MHPAPRGWFGRNPVLFALEVEPRGRVSWGAGSFNPDGNR
jgi:hypothetical protein